MKQKLDHQLATIRRAWHKSLRISVNRGANVETTRKTALNQDHFYSAKNMTVGIKIVKQVRHVPMLVYPLHNVAIE